MPVLCSTSLLYNILPTNLVACKPAFYTFYISHLGGKQHFETLFFYHTGQNAVFHNFAGQIALCSFGVRSARNHFSPVPRP